MGKRKERRLAAKASSNRRVKLDLFAEPSGEMMDNSVHDEVGGDLDQDHAGAPTSPSSSGQRQENPLLLLGQYSDDELDEEDSKRPKLAADENFTTDLDGQDTEADVSVGNTEEALTACNNEQELDLVNAVKNVDGNDIKENVSNNESAQYCDTAPAPPVNIPECAGDATSGWKMVMHEESNRYYYWNTLTGETSWEVPTDLAGEHNVSSAVDGAVVHADIHVPTHLNPESEAYGYVSSADGLGGSNLISSEAGDYGGALVATNENGEVAHMAYDVSQSLTHYSTAAASIPYVHSSSQPDFVSPHGVGPDVHSASLVNYIESLLQRLEALDRSGHRLERRELIVNEIEIRLTDCKALSSYGSSLLPFWWHVEAQLKQLEAVISKGEASWLIHSKHNSKLETPQVSSLINECSLQSIETESEVIEKDKVVSHIVEHSCSSPAIGDASKVGNETSSQLPNSNDVKIDNQHLGSVQEPYIAPESNPDTPIKLESELESNAEDVDMDVEMEVDEEVQPVQEAVGDQPILSSHEQLSQSYQPSPECPPDSLDESSVPPPPEEEWIPPPPPDSELVPPPPPEEPEPAIPPLPHAEAISYPAYHDSYNLPYTASVYEYYAPTAGEPMNVNYYAPAGGTHIADPHATPYFEPVVASSVEVNPVQPVGYYDVSSGAGPPGPVDSSMGSSGYYIESEPISYCYTVSASDHTSSLGFSMDSGNSKLPVANLESGTTTAITEPQMSTSHSVSNASTVQPVATPLVNGADVKAPSSTIPKGQTKVVRSKKRTVAAAPALRSNKKVASLVDKWKAAKEELHGDEDEDEDEEPENAYEVLEKKRQKEIEEWRVRQIASGEAQDNANFLPLGGDWRERVKRKKAAAKAEAVQSPLEIVENDRKQPDLVELSKDLPSGWQAYWDESTKEVYYGNNITSETTWTKPAR